MLILDRLLSCIWFLEIQIKIGTFVENSACAYVLNNIHSATDTAGNFTVQRANVIPTLLPLHAGLFELNGHDAR